MINLKHVMMSSSSMTIPSVFAALLLFPSTASAQQNVTVITVDPVDRLSGAAVLGEWTANGNVDGWSGSNVTGLTAAGGLLTGDDNSTTADASVSRSAIPAGPDLDFGFNDYIQLRVKLPAGYAGDVKFEYGTTTNTGFAATRQFVLPAASIIKDGAFHTYRLDLGLEVFWRDTLRDLRVTPLLAATGRFEIDYIEVGDVAGTAPALNLDTNFGPGLTAANTTRLESKHVCLWWDPNDATFTLAHARRALRMSEESYQVFCRKLGYNEPFRQFDSTTTPRYKVNFITWYGGFWAGGYANRSHMNVGSSGLADEGSGNPVPHEFAHVVQMAQPGRMVGGHWESHANYLRAQRNLHFYAAIPGANPGIDNLTGNCNYRPDHNRHIYADQRYYLALDDYGTQFGLPANYAATMWRDGLRDKTMIEKLSTSLPVGTSVKDVAGECCKHWPMLDFVEKTRLRAQHWGTTAARNEHFWKQGAQLVPLQDKAGWWRVPLERAPDRWAYQMHDLTAAAGASITAELRGLDMPGTGEDWRWCFAAISAGDMVRYSPVWAPGTQSFTLNAGETKVFLIVTATPDSVTLDLDSLSNTKPVDKHLDRLRYGYEVRLVNASPTPNRYAVANPTGFRTHPNGGGVLASGATAASTAYVGPNAKVLGTARVLGNARVEDNAVVQGSATVQGNAVVSGAALLDNNALVEGDARVRDRAHLVGGAVVRGRALVAGYTRIENTTVTDDAIVRGCAFPFSGTVSGTAILDHDYSMGSSVSNGIHFSHVPWGGWWDVYYPQAQRKPRGLIASYRTEETGGEEWWDEFGALHAFLRGSPARTTDAAPGTAVVTFDGVDDYAAFDRSVADTSRFSFGCWVKPVDAPGAAEPLLFLGSSATRAAKLVRNAAGNAVFTISDGSTTGTLTSTSTLPANQWTHLAVTLNGTTGTLYVGGNPEATAGITLTPLSTLAANDGTAAQANYLGRDWAGALFKGGFDDVRFYNVALTAAEVREESARRGDLLGQFSPSVAMDFNGTTATAESGVRNGRVRTLSAWVKPRSSGDVTNYEAVFDSDDERGGAQGSGIGLDAGKWVARLDGLGNWATNVTATLNAWQHVALAFNGTTATLFINGVQAATRSYTGPASDSAAAGKCYRIGFSQTAEDSATRQFFDGWILNARVHDRALTAAQIVLDSDGDGLTDSAEADLGSDPLNPQSQGSPRTISGKVSDTSGAALSGATVYFSQSPDAAANATLTAVTDASGNYSRIVTPGTWYVVASGTGFNPGTERTVVAASADVTGIDFSLAAASPPTLSNVEDQTTDEDNATAAIPFTIGDADTPLASLTVSATSSNTTLVPDANIVLAGTGASRSVTLTPVMNLSGTTTITLTVSDGFLTASDTFTLLVNGDSDGDGRTDVKEVAAGRNAASASDLGFEFNTDGDFEDWSGFTRITAPTVLGGVLKGTSSAADPFFSRNGFSFAGNSVANMIVKIKLSAAEPVQMFWARIGSPGFAAAKSITASSPPANTWRTLVLPVGPNVEWAGQTITSLRFDPGTQTAQAFEIDWIRASNGDLDGDGVSDTNEATGDSDGDGLLNIEDPNTAPTVSTLTNQTLSPGVATVPLAFTIGDPETAATALTLSATSSNLAIVPNANILLGGSGANRTVTVTPVANKLGTSIITLNVSDGTATTSATFTVNITGTASETWRFTHFGTTANTGNAASSADPDNDGENNLLEFATGQNPNTSGRTITPISLSGNLLEFSYSRSLAALTSGMIFTVEYSDSLAGNLWDSLGVTQQILTDNGTLQTVKATCPAGPGGKRFMRLRVALP